MVVWYGFKVTQSSTGNRVVNSILLECRLRNEAGLFQIFGPPKLGMTIGFPEGFSCFLDGNAPDLIRNFVAPLWEPLQKILLDIVP